MNGPNISKIGAKKQPWKQKREGMRENDNAENASLSKIC